jgi:carboxyl-terminal processing protease
MNISYKNIFLWVSFTLLGYSIAFFSTNNYFSYFSIQTEKTSPKEVQIQDVFHSEKSQEAYQYIENNYYGFYSKNKKDIEDAFIKALATSLGDKHTSYFNETDAIKFIDTLKGDFEGIGAVIHENIKGIQIMKVLSGSPAEKGKLVAGDIITHVDGESMIGMTADEAVNNIRWPKGSTVKLTILRKNDNEKQEIVDIKRDTIIIPTIYSTVLTGSTIGYIEISMFGGDTVREFTQAFHSLTASGITGIIIDGRNNGGGFLDAAVDILSVLLPPNTVTVSTKGNNPLENMVLYTKGEKNEKNTAIPVIMLVNTMSASATEIVAWALQEHKRALVVGEKTYGKGSVQTPFSLSDGSILKLTTARWYTPHGRSIDEKGIEPDIKISLTDDDYKDGNDRQLEWVKKLIQLQWEKKLSVEELKKEAEKLTF